MTRALAWTFVLLAQDASPRAPVPPGLGTGAHVVTTLTNAMEIRVTAAGKVVQETRPAIEETTDATIEVVQDPAHGRAFEPLNPQDEKDVIHLDSPPPFVRVDYVEALAGVPGTPRAEWSKTPESGQKYVFERGVAGAPLHDLFGRTVKDDAAARVRVDADAFLAGPRFAPSVLGRALKEGEVLDVPLEALTPLVAQAVKDGTLTAAKLTCRGTKRDGAQDVRAFDVTLAVRWKGGGDVPVTATFDLAGELLLVPETAQVLAFDVSGPIRCSGASGENGAQLEVTGTGKLTFHYRADPITPK